MVVDSRARNYRSSSDSKKRHYLYASTNLQAGPPPHRALHAGSRRSRRAACAAFSNSRFRASRNISASSLRICCIACSGVSRTALRRDALARPRPTARAFHDVLDGLADRFRHDAVLGVVSDLLCATPVHLGDRTLHRTRHPVGIKDRRAVLVARRAADGLDQRALRPQKSFLVRIQDRDQRHFGHVEAFAQQIDADQHVEFARAAGRG